MDGWLSESHLSFELNRAEISDRRMTPDRIVEPLDIVEHIRPGLVSGVIDFARGALGLQRREEALHRGVVPHIAGPAHAANDAAVGHQPLELLAGVLAALIGVMQ